MIEITNITKAYGSNMPPAVDNVSLKFERGKIYGLLGRNGAGKTTLINLITNRIIPTSGKITIAGLPAFENDFAQEHVFCMTEKGSYGSDTTGRQAIRWAAEFYPNFDRGYAMALIAKFKVDIKKRIRMLSTGYGSILKLILTLASGADVMIFDEPTLGLDAGMREMFYAVLLERYSELGNTMILSTHLIVEVADMLERVVIIDDGRIIVDDEVENLTQRAYVVSGKASEAEKFAAGKDIIGRQNIGSMTAITIDGKLTKEERTAAEKAGLEISGAKLQDIFIRMTGAKEAK